MRRTSEYNHKITSDDFEVILKRQDYRCAICLIPVEQASSDRRNLHIDHDHNCCPGHRSCGKCIRGLLCANCNMGIGHFKDDVSILIKAVRYLKTADYYAIEEYIDSLDLMYGM